MTNQPCSGTDTPAAVSRSFCGDFLFNTFCADHPENPGNILAECRTATAVADFSFYAQTLFHFSVTDHNVTLIFPRHTILISGTVHP
ncbi:TPA: hypothetical protein ACF637_004289 [Salmonella enterica]|nr:hypothetical protein [Salmonella enterica]EGT6677089.1 hypothetical protein [Salmonella enterica subsp. enterica serovar Kottbus]EGP4122173.1 hypothetical protein [Salmonella enterica]EGT8104913.1 hypothetical protein [Salmonella enterica subsp. enterica serovar Kottbus]EHR1638868.1 hypothetical protein [Salmonella enterica subsp. enterica serovar Kottbus]EHS5192977.1 hypothetical protein [Salmonella enterica subsp. enterica serovar Kottbus]